LKNRRKTNVIVPSPAPISINLLSVEFQSEGKFKNFCKKLWEKRNILPLKNKGIKNFFNLKNLPRIPLILVLVKKRERIEAINE